MPAAAASGACSDRRRPSLHAAADRPLLARLLVHPAGAKARKQCEAYFSPEMSRSMTSCGDALEDLAEGGAGQGSCPASCGGVLDVRARLLRRLRR